MHVMVFGQSISRAAFSSVTVSPLNYTLEAGIKPAVKVSGVSGLVAAAAALTITGLGGAAFATGGALSDPVILSTLS